MNNNTRLQICLYKAYLHMLISSNMKRMKIKKKEEKWELHETKEEKKMPQQQHTKYLFYMQR